MDDRELPRVFTADVYRTVTLRSIGVAAAVTVICVGGRAADGVLHGQGGASPRLRRLLVVAVLTPLWASYLVKAYAWRGDARHRRRCSTGRSAPFGLSGPGFGLTATVIVLAYLWLPYMILPIYAGLERLPDSLLEASGDLGAGGWRTLRSVVLPLVLPVDRGRLDLHVLAEPRRLHRRADRRRQDPAARQPRSTPTSARRTTCRSPPRSPPSRSRSWCCTSGRPPHRRPGQPVRTTVSERR